MQSSSSLENRKPTSYDVIVIGAGAAGLMAAAKVGRRGKSVLLIEHTSKIGEKIRISGGGRCNFTNINASYMQYLSHNPHFIKSALARYTPNDFIKLLESYNIAYHEKTLGQLFCDGSAKQIIEMLVNECKLSNVKILLECVVNSIKKEGVFHLETGCGQFVSKSLVIASGGLSIPKIGASDFGYRIAKQFHLNVVPPRPALVPLTVEEQALPFYHALSGVSLEAIVTSNKTKFRENILFTHRGLSGPAILQISSYILSPQHEPLFLNLLPDVPLKEIFHQEKNSPVLLSTVLKRYLPNRFVENWCDNNSQWGQKRLCDHKLKTLEEIAVTLQRFPVPVKGTEGYLKAEVTAGGVDTAELSSQTLEAVKVPGLYFIGEVVDVTGWLGGYNFQWAWSSAHAASLYI